MCVVERQRFPFLKMISNQSKVKVGLAARLTWGGNELCLWIPPPGGTLDQGLLNDDRESSSCLLPSVLYFFVFAFLFLNCVKIYFLLL